MARLRTHRNPIHPPQKRGNKFCGIRILDAEPEISLLLN